MADFTYPSNDLQQRQRLLSTLGSFWSDVYAGVAQVEDYVAARGELEQQGFVNLQEAADAISRLTVPVFHTERHYQLSLQEGSRDTTEAAQLRFGGDGVFGASAHLYGRAQVEHWAFPLPADLVDVHLITNRVTDPSLTLVNGIDFVINATQSTITFKQNPFDNELFVQSDVMTGDVVTDKEINLWLHNAKFDHLHIYTHFSHIFDTKLPSSAHARQLLNAVMDAVTNGTAKEQVTQALSALTDISLAKESEEVVEITKDHSHTLVLTDKNVYRFSKSATALVAKGDNVVPGQSLVDSLQVFELNRGTLPDVRALALEEGYLATGYYGPLQFENKAETLTVIENDTTERTRLEFPIGGHPLDVTKFFADMHANGIARGKTLANLMDTRTVQVGEPTAANLPTTINPFEFLVKNVLRGNVFLATLKVGDIGKEALGFEYGHLLRRVIPPHTGMLLLLELQGFRDSVTLGNDVETLGTFTGLTPLEDQIPGDSSVSPESGALVGTERVSIHKVSGTCQ